MQSQYRKVIFGPAHHPSCGLQPADKVNQKNYAATYNPHDGVPLLSSFDFLKHEMSLRQPRFLTGLTAASILVSGVKCIILSRKWKWYILRELRLRDCACHLRSRIGVFGGFLAALTCLLVCRTALASLSE